MSFSLIPDRLTYGLTSVSPEWLQKENIQLLMMDFDNTIVPYTTDMPSEETVMWLKRMQESGIVLCVVSNSRHGRVVAFCERYCLPCITRAKKPGRRGIRESLRHFQVLPENAALVGDQIFTDTLAANRSGVKSILVPAIDNHNFWLKARHVAELPFIFVAKRRMKHGKH